MSSRLENKYPALAAEIKGANEHLVRQAIFQSCSNALALSGVVDDDFASAALRFLVDGIGDKEYLKSNVEQLAFKFDDEYIKKGESGEVGEAEGLSLFSKARAFSALAFALSDEPHSALDAIYEAIMASDDGRAMVGSVLKSLRA